MYTCTCMYVRVYVCIYIYINIYIYIYIYINTINPPRPSADELPSEAYGMDNDKHNLILITITPMIYAQVGARGAAALGELLHKMYVYIYIYIYIYIYVCVWLLSLLTYIYIYI